MSFHWVHRLSHNDLTLKNDSNYNNTQYMTNPSILIFSGNLTLICYLPGQVGEQIPHFLSIYFPYLSTFVEHQLPPASSSLTQLLCVTPAQIKGKTHGWSGSGLSLLVCPLLLFRRVRQLASVPVNILFHFISTSQLKP